MEFSDSVPVFSVVMPIYNRSDMVETSVKTVLTQTFVDFELICVNDGSTDSTLEILKTLALQDKRIVIIDQENKGRCIARNAAIKAAKGKWIAFLDSDDGYLENHLQTFYELIKTYPQYCGFATELILDNRVREYHASKFYQDNVVLDLTDFSRGNPISLNQFCFERSKSPDLYFPSENIIAAEDLLFFRMFSYMHKILKVSRITNYATEHQNRSVNLISPEDFIYWNTYATTYFLRHYQLSSKMESRINSYLHLLIGNVLLSAKRRRAGAMELFQAMKYLRSYGHSLFYKGLLKLII
jgi:glycosyltransferase involved in cell wall biosynthesis